MREGQESRQPGFNRNFYLGDFYKIKDLTPTQMEQIENGDFGPVTQQLQNLPEGKERDRVALDLDGEVSELVKGVDIALEVAREYKDAEAIEKLSDIESTLDRLMIEIQSFMSGQ